LANGPIFCYVYVKVSNTTRERGREKRRGEKGREESLRLERGEGRGGGERERGPRDFQILEQGWPSTGHLHPISLRQSRLQPSPSIAFPSSQVSPSTLTPSPQTAKIFRNFLP
jgi:hypothetical protein